MDARDATRKNQWLPACQVAPEIFQEVMPRRHPCMDPFVETWHRQRLQHQARTAVSGLLSDVARTNVASIASRFGHDRLPRPRGIGGAPWDEEPWRKAWRGHVAKHLGHQEGVLGCDPSALPTSGTASVGGARQWCGRLGHVDHGHVARSLGDVAGQGHPLVDRRRSLPNAWSQETGRLDQAGVPHNRRGSRPRHPLALERLAPHGAALPHGGIAGDDERGRPSGWRRRRAALGARALLAVPSPPLRRALETPPPAESGQGRRPQRPWPSVAPWSQALGDAAWHRLDGRDGATGPLGVDGVKRRVVSRPPRRQPGDEERGVVRRSRGRDQQQVGQGDFSRSQAAPETPLGQCARVANAAHRLAEGLQRSTNEAGLAADEVRHGTGWPHHHTRS